MKAWKVEIAPNTYALVARQALGHLLDEFDLTRVPSAPKYARHVSVWNAHLLPVINLTALKKDNLQDIEHRDSKGGLSIKHEANVGVLMGIVAYQYQNQVLQGGMIFQQAPILIDVPDTSVAMPDSGFPWSSISKVCVEIDDEAFPILDLDCLFTMPIEIKTK